MKSIISNRLLKVAELLIEQTGLDDQDIRRLTHDAPEILKKLKKSIDEKKDPFTDLNKDDKRLLLAFIVYKRQNLVMSPMDNPNDEDAAKILHGEVFDGSNKKIQNDIDKELRKQLLKAGINLEIKKEE